MRATIRPALLVTAILLILGLTAPAASASGRSKHGDRKRHHLAGHSQGRSSSDPDGMTNGGRDKPGFRGGFSADRDGNNGCGNDDDREDDNNGNCGRRKARVEGAQRQKDDDDDDRDSVVFEAKLHALVLKLAMQDLVFEPAVLAAIEAAFAPAAAQPVSQPAPAAQPVSQPAPAAQPVSQPAPAEVAAAPPAETAVLGTQLERQPSPALAPETKVAGAQENRFGALATTGMILGGLALLGAALVVLGRLARGAGSA